MEVAWVVLGVAGLGLVVGAMVGVLEGLEIPGTDADAAWVVGMAAFAGGLAGLTAALTDANETTQTAAAVGGGLLGGYVSLRIAAGLAEGSRSGTGRLLGEVGILIEDAGPDRRGRVRIQTSDHEGEYPARADIPLVAGRRVVLVDRDHDGVFRVVAEHRGVES
jgi:hypothetical protein